MSQRASEKNLTLPKDLYLVDITLDNNITDAADERLEHTFFNINPELGEVIDWPIIGNPFNPVNMSLSTVIADLPTYEKSDIDQLTNRMPMLRAMLQTPPTKRFATAFIVHCHCGCDRTGEVSLGPMRWST